MQLALVTGTGPAFIGSVDGPLVAALGRRGVRVDAPRWDDDAIDWERYDAAVVRTTWDYTGRRDAFVTWASDVARVTSLWNPADVLRWNTHKSYLIELEERGAPVVPTAWLGQGDDIDLVALLAARGWERAVLKPTVGSGSDGLARIDVHRSDGADAGGGPGGGAVTSPAGPVPGGAAPRRPPVLGSADGQRHLDVLLAAGDVMVQPFLASIETQGELSVIVVDGEVTHAVRKVPTGGDYRIQEEFGGRAEQVDPSPEEIALARWIVDATGAELLVSRVDLVADEVGAPQLAELEATEPDLFLRVVPDAAEPLADAIVSRIAPRR